MENGYVQDEFFCYFLSELQNCVLIAVSRVATSTHLRFSLQMEFGTYFRLIDFSNSFPVT